MASNATNAILQLPLCALSCLQNILPSECDATNVRSCYCPNIALQFNVAACVTLSCDTAEQSAASLAQHQTCAGLPIQSRTSFLALPVLVLNIVFWILVSLRFLVRWKITKKFWWDDWSMLTALVFEVAIAVVAYELIRRGLGEHVWDIDYNNVPSLDLLFYLIEILYVLNLFWVKVSILFLYLRIFEGVIFRRICYATQIFLVGFCLTFVLLLLLRCSPVSAGWAQYGSALNAKCLDLHLIILIGGVLNIATDVWILLLPIPKLYSLSMDRGKKVQVMLMFNIGLLACAMSCIRLKFVSDYRADAVDSTWDNSDLVFWTTLELGVAYLCANLPSVRPLLRVILPKRSGTMRSASAHSRGGAMHSSWLSRPGSLSVNNRDFRRLPSPDDPDALLESTDCKSAQLSIDIEANDSTSSNTWHVDEPNETELVVLESGQVVLKHHVYGQAL